MTYYGLSMTSVSLADDMYLGFLLTTLVEIPGVAAFYLTIDRWGRRKCCIIYHIIAGVSLLLSVVLSAVAGEAVGVSHTVVALSLVGKFAISVSFGVIFLYTPELYPTNLRNASLGIASMLGRVGGMVAPYSRTLIKHYPWAPGTIFGVCCLLVPIFMRILPETSECELPQTIGEMKLRFRVVTGSSKKSRSKKMTGVSDV
ncbi:hypothetical protein C0Q70_20138 [Pomacea canaliculata]|uniref:Major facilitator superfamily (MFS) profile domain-containing protein n=1 Tax=Pomacea canaliculata TaxID=400727 RepID=A0A2T7NEP5_POMCA|nr:hypothetical protein C0Q70_20138 [Pomacea canaliculata]